MPGPAGPLIAIDVAPAKIRAPYDVQIIRENGETLPTYAMKDRFYVQGTAGERYTIRINNPTPRRVEAVVSVDGLDAVDGEAGDLHKRGYIVPPYSDERIEGFRTSLEDVATFRFSSVDGSYAAGKGKARNVGVIAVAIFEENAPPPPPEEQIGRDPAPYRYEDDVDASVRPSSRPDRARDVAKAEKQSAAPSPPAPTVAPTTPRVAPAGGYGGAVAARPSPPERKRPADDIDGVDDEVYQPAPTPQAPVTNRPGLGTEFGETRYSSASYTQFVRAAGRPIAIAELRYNDAGGLMALGIPIAPLPDSGEIMLRETADPFPGDHFARPPVR